VGTPSLLHSVQGKFSTQQAGEVELPSSLIEENIPAHICGNGLLHR
jgi:hypothetical protein